MHAHRSSPDQPPAPTPMREEDVRRMLAARTERAPAPRRNNLRRFLLRLAVMFTLYVLSIGPLYWKWYAAKVGLGSPVFILLYRPLETLAELIPPLGHFLNWYISLWIY
jgi:hypothetical protein